MGDQKLHLVRQNPPVAQDEVFPEAGYIGRVEQGHARLFRRAGALAVVAGTAGSHQIHPVMAAACGDGHDVFAREVVFVEDPAAVGTDAAVACEQLAVGQARLQAVRIDGGRTARADDAVDVDDRLAARDGIVATAETGDFPAGLPAHIVRRVMQRRLLQRNPGLGQPLGRQLQDLHDTPPLTPR